MMTIGRHAVPGLTVLLLACAMGGWIVVEGLVPMVHPHRPASAAAASSMSSILRTAKTRKLTSAWSYGSRTKQPSPSPPLAMSSSDPGETKQASNKLPFWLDVGTKGGALVISAILFIVPIIIYAIVTSVFGFDEIEAGKWIGVGFTAIATFLWVGTYIFRVATKDMTYVRFLFCLVVLFVCCFCCTLFFFNGKTSPIFKKKKSDQ